MFANNDFRPYGDYRQESIAYALASGMVDLTDDRDGEKAARRARFVRRRMNKKAR